MFSALLWRTPPIHTSGLGPAVLRPWSPIRPGLSEEEPNDVLGNKRLSALLGVTATAFNPATDHIQEGFFTTIHS